jgi:hypothetical protein
VSPGRRAYQYGRVPRPILYAESGVSDRACRLFAILTVEQFASKEDSPDPSLQEMAGWLGCSDDTAARAVRELEKAGMIEKRKRRNGPRQATSEYVLIGDGITLPAPVSDPHPRDSEPKVQTRTHEDLADQREQDETAAQTGDLQTRTHEDLMGAAHIRAKGSTRSVKAKKKPASPVSRTRDGNGTTAQGSLDGITDPQPPLEPGSVQGEVVHGEIIPAAPAEPEPEPDAARLARLLAASITRRTPQLKPPKVTPAWIADMDGLLRIDGLPPERVEELIGWLEAGEDDDARFWAPNIRSPHKLRKQAGTLLERLDSNGNGNSARNGNTGKRRVAFRQIAATGSVGISADARELDDWARSYQPPAPGSDPYLDFIRGNTAAPAPPAAPPTAAPEEIHEPR